MEEAKTVNKMTVVNRHGASGGLYFVGFLGAFIYYMQTATTFGDGVVGFLKALAWPGTLVYHLFKFLGL
jgi:hypothetical protein